MSLYYTSEYMPPPQTAVPWLVWMELEIKMMQKIKP
jgi:hypothetical protein